MNRPKENWIATGWLAAWILFFLVAVIAFASVSHAAEPPPAALPYQRTVIREARAAWGLNAPAPVMAAQIQQESRWNPNAKSSFAAGLAQFTPQTAEWISGAYPGLEVDNPYNPAWAIRALVLYDKKLYTAVAPASSDCDQWGFTLSAYNGGLGWIARDRSLCETNTPCGPLSWFKNVELWSSRSPAAFRENRHYPVAILKQWQPNYETWGRSVSCPA